MVGVATPRAGTELLESQVGLLTPKASDFQKIVFEIVVHSDLWGATWTP